MSKISKDNTRLLFEPVRSLSAPAVKSLPSGYGSDQNPAVVFTTGFIDIIDRITSGELCPCGGVF